jgi:predicted RNase H-like HicB family nuclease
MTTIEAIIERAKDGTYNIYCTEEIFSGAGDSIDAAKDDLLRQMQFYKETALAEGFKYPAFLDGEFSVLYKVDMASLLRFYVNSGIFSLAGVSKLSGINQKQLWSYVNGTKPRKAQTERLEKGFRTLTKDLNTLFPVA